MEEIKDFCDVCEKQKESTYNEIREEYMCEYCWDRYFEYLDRA